MFTKEGYRIKIAAVIDGEQKVLYAGYKAWKRNDLYPTDFTKRYHSVAYAMDAEALYLSVGLMNTSYKEEYCLWVNSEEKVIVTWRPNVTYLRKNRTWSGNLPEPSNKKLRYRSTEIVGLYFFHKS